MVNAHPVTTSTPSCPPGTVPTQTGCTQCPQHSFSAGSVCQSCPAFHSSAAGSASLSDCVPNPWTTTGWSACSVSCGGSGLQTRIVMCSTGDNTCDPAAKPGHERVCNMEACPSWVSSDYASCSVLQVRNVWCSTGTDSDCDQSIKPDESQVCGAVHWACDSLQPNQQGDCPPQWTARSWRSCSATCGSGTQTRIVRCSSGQDSDCNANTRPVDSQSCTVAACPTTAPPLVMTTAGSMQTTAGSLQTTAASMQTTAASLQTTFAASLQTTVAAQSPTWTAINANVTGIDDARCEADCGSSSSTTCPEHYEPELPFYPFSSCLPPQTQLDVEWCSSDLQRVPQWACALACPTGSAFCPFFRGAVRWPESHCVPCQLKPTNNPSATAPSATSARQNSRETETDPDSINNQPQDTRSQAAKQDGQTQAPDTFGPGDNDVVNQPGAHTSSSKTQSCGLWCWLLPIVVCSSVLVICIAWFGWLKRSQQKKHEDQLRQMRTACSWASPVPSKCQL